MNAYANSPTNTILTGLPMHPTWKLLDCYVTANWYSSDLRGTGIFRCVSFKFFLQLDCCTKSKSVELNQNANNHVLLNQNIYNSEGFLKIKLRDFTFILFFTLYFFSSTKWLLKAEFISSKKSYSRSYILRFYLLF